MKHFPTWTTILRRALVGLAVAATIAAAAYVEEDWRGERAYERFVQACAAEGKPLDYAFYRLASVPDDENFFHAPVLARFFNPEDQKGKAWSEYKGESQFPWEIWKGHGDWKRGKATDFIAAARLLNPNSPPVAEGSKGASLVLDRLNVIQPDLDAIRDAARARPRSRIAFLTDGSFIPGSIGALRVYTNALDWRACAELELGRNDDAFGDTYAAMRFAQGAADFPSDVHLMIACVIVYNALQPFWEGCRRNAWTGPQLEAFGRLVDTIHPVRAFPAAHAAGRAACVSEWLARKSSIAMPRWMPTGWKKLNIVEYYRANAALDASAFDPAEDRIDLRRTVLAAAEVRRLSDGHSPFSWLVRHDAMSPRMSLTFAEGQDSLALAGTVCAIGRYRVDHGAFPESAKELVPRYLSSLPKDVFSGDTLVYVRLSPDRFRLWFRGLKGFSNMAAFGDGIKDGVDPWTSPENVWDWPNHP